MPYVIAAAVGLALLVLFPIPVLLALSAWGLWTGRGYDRALAILGLATIVMADEQRITAIMWLTLVLRRPPSSYDGTFEDNTGCGPECRSVLAAGRVDWVRVAMLGSTDGSTVYRRADAAECAGNPIGKLVLPMSCVLIADDPGGVA